MIRTKGLRAPSDVTPQIIQRGGEQAADMILGIGQAFAAGLGQVRQNRERAAAEARAEEKIDLAADRESWDRQQWLATQTGEVPAGMAEQATAPIRTKRKMDAG